jgi:membrane-associated protein
VVGVGTFSEFLYSIAMSPWALVVLAVLLIMDGFLPIVPGETTVVALAALGASGHGPSPLSVFFVGSAATVLGDGIAFYFGRLLGARSGKWSHRPRISRPVNWAARHIEHRPARILIIAKFIPYARVAISMTTGASTLRVRRYVPLAAAAAAMYTLYHVVVATTFGTLFTHSPLVGLAVSIAFGLVVSALAAITRALRRRRTPQLSARDTHEPVGESRKRAADH